MTLSVSEIVLRLCATLVQLYTNNISVTRRRSRGRFLSRNDSKKLKPSKTQSPVMSWFIFLLAGEKLWQRRVWLVILLITTWMELLFVLLAHRATSFSTLTLFSCFGKYSIIWLCPHITIAKLSSTCLFGHMVLLLWSFKLYLF